MPESKMVDPAPAGTDRAPDPETRLLNALGMGDQPEEETKPEEAVDAQPETPVEGSGDAAAEGDAEETTEPQDETPAEPTLYDVKVDGVVQKVSLEEALAGYSRTQDYTRKTQAVSQKEREAEAALRGVAQDRERYVEGLKQVEALLGQNAEEPDWEKLADELPPEEFQKTQARWNKRQSELGRLRTKRETEEQRANEDRAKAHQAYLREEQARLYAAVPEWKDEPKARAEQQKLTEYALRVGKDYGITEDALAGIDSAFPILMLRKAMLYDEMMAAKPKVVKQTTHTTSVKPGAKVTLTKVSPVMVARAKLKETGDPKYAEEIILQQLLADEAGPRR